MISKRIQESIEVKKAIIKNDELIQTIDKVTRLIVHTYKNNGKVYFCGNGGSAADAQHLAAELSGRFYFDRPPLHAEACHVNTSFLTAAANDYGFHLVYARYVKAVAKKDDVLVGLSTSGNSLNIIEALKMAKEIGMKTVAFTGTSGGKLKSVTDFLINVPSNDTPRIQEAHILLGHIICETVEQLLFNDSK
jgi:D-sedoheptulose 7-phosphate isomerase